ncbi:hypothetical protein BDQ12DRAFT_678093 [Crucibulum laeve]|uniref:Uncharacterized protein n=1 Tax=Crucibulum laeve TaxID=68775 RepID=A0A5C3M9E6_9AGAR|nr:hypothetical protein BDQ12DRAFT_678093 [Crucibulum laeve]
MTRSVQIFEHAGASATSPLVRCTFIVFYMFTKLPIYFSSYQISHMLLGVLLLMVIRKGSISSTHGRMKGGYF